MSRLARMAGAAALVSSAAFGYYHFVHYSFGSSPFSGIPEKFDLSALPNSTVTYHIAENGTANYAPTDGFALVVSQIRAAAKVWNDVETSELRLRFGGVTQQGANQNAATPSIDVVFEDLPPGVNGYGGPTVRNDIVNNAAGALIPIQRSVVVLAKDIASRPSWSEQYYLTAVHEFGHALGLQHSLVSGAMATEITRATTKIRPILPDDAVGLSLLYPTRAFRDGLGAVAGRVATGANEGMGLASVVAVSPGGAAIGTLTHPDGTFRLDGLVPGQYFLYAHPLPPTLQGEATPGNVVLPVDGSGRALSGGQQFDTVFYPASRAPFATIAVTANSTVEGVNFAVTRRVAPTSIHSVQTYSFPGQRAVKPAHVYTAGARNLVVIAGNGLVEGGQPVTGLQIGSIGGSASVSPGGIRPYAPAPDSYLQAEVQFGQFAGESPVHLMFSRGNDLYVLPYGVRVVERAAPQIESVTRGDGADAIVTGSGLNASTRVAFDGVWGTFRSFEEGSGRLTVTPPVSAQGATMHVVAFGSDGQSSLFVQQAVNYTSSVAETAAVGLSTASLPAGTESVVEITGANFAEGTTSIGFGTPDIDVRRVWFPTPNRALANIWVAAGAAGNSYTFTILNGLRLTTQTGALQVSSAKAAWLSVPAAGGLTSGSAATIQVNGLALSGLSALQLTVNDRPAQILGVDGSTVLFTVPSGLAPGVAVVRLQSGAETALPLAVTVSQQQAVISSVTAGFGTVITPQRPARYGELMSLLVTGLPENFAPAGSAPKVTLTIGGIDHRLITVSPGGGFLQLQFTIQTVVPPGTHPVAITVEGVSVAPYSLPVRAF
ncbi:MAG: matrixin family metalloprotease [Bryobacteraceae bacterium]